MEEVSTLHSMLRSMASRQSALLVGESRKPTVIQ
jgi:hypothetical protein